ncbi:MAG: carbohydrate ABC transporter substrate-binding protein [Lachnospiraceae bacterium]|nr:carbohydrate ABC transporter substrate-binding protein [Lachnospiraceae bacterium]
MKRRNSLLMALLLTVSMVFTACGSNDGAQKSASSDSAPAAASSDSTEASTEAGGKADLVWWGWTPGSPLNEQYIAEFNKSFPDVNITWKQTTVDDYDAAIKPALANGEGVDIFEVSAGSANGGVGIFGGQAISMEEALKNYLGEDYKDKLNEASLNSMTVNGELKALGVGTVYAGNLWINQDLFDKYNVKVPTNFEEWKAACDTFKANGIIGFVQGAGQGAFNMDTYHAICDNIEPGLFTKATRGEAEWTNPVFVQALDLWKKLFDEGIMQDGALGIQQYPEANNMFLSGQAAMVMMGSWYTMNCLPDTMRANMEAASSTDEPFAMVPINFPDIAGTGNTGYVFCDIDYATAVSVNASDVQAATDFALWLGASEEGQQMIADSLNLVPVLKSVSPNWDNVVLTNPEKQNKPVQEYLTNAMANPDNPRFGGISADLNQAMMDVLAGVASGTLTSEDGAARLAAVE